MIDATAALPALRRIASGRLRILREQQQRDQHVVQRDAPAFGRTAQTRVLRLVEREERECVVAVVDRAVARADRPAAARRHRRQPRKAAHEAQRVTREEPPVRARISRKRGRCRLAGVAVDDRVQQNDRIAAGDEMVVGNAEEERVARVECEEPERVDSAFHRERLVQVPLERLRERRLPLVAGCDDLERAGRRPAAPFVAPRVAVELEARQPGVLQRLVDRARRREPIERTGDARGVNGDVRMELAPVEHRPLEQVQPAREALHPRAVRAVHRTKRAHRRCRARRGLRVFLHDGHGKICQLDDPKMSIGHDTPLAVSTPTPGKAPRGP
jgi:hypothetical protein